MPNTGNCPSLGKKLSEHGALHGHHVLAKPPCFRSAVFASGYSDITLSYPSFLHPLRPGQVSSLDQPGYGALINQDHNCTAQYYGT
eukprot:scaffold6606_cov16-Tisochrysis_lutea.AAC.1